ncbi:TPA: MFS transporter [Candidatus Woesearchaeota archaeon]|nr:MFS transporter [Candidatus Woesearchaeota archaeon]
MVKKKRKEQGKARTGTPMSKPEKKTARAERLSPPRPTPTIQKPFTSVDEELHNVNKKIKEYSKKIGVKKERTAAIEIDIEMKKTHRILDAVLKLKYYVATYTVAIGILAYLMGTPKLFFIHFIYGAVLLWLSHKLHRESHRYGLGIRVSYIGLMIIPLYWIYTNTYDLMSLVMTVLYMICFVVTVALYFHHTSKEIQRELHQSFTRTFLVVWYSHVISLASAVALMYHLPKLILTDNYVSIMYLLTALFIPAFFVYFSVNKLLYLRFFDPFHMKKDVSKAALHGIAYTGLFIACIALIYLLTAVNVAIVERENSLENIDESIDQLNQLKIDILTAAEETYSTEINEMMVTREIVENTDQLIKSFESRKAVTTQPFGVWDYFTDHWFGAVADKRLALTFLQTNRDNAIHTTQQLIFLYKNLSLENETTIQQTREFVETHYEPFTETPELKEFKDDINTMRTKHRYMLEGNRLYNFAMTQSYTFGLQIFTPGKTLFSERLFDTLSYLKIFRDALFFATDNILYSSRDLTNPEIMDALYYKRDVQESQQSKAIRYKLLEEEYNSLEGRA